MAVAAAPISDSLHADLLVVVEPGGAVVCTDPAAGDSPRLLSKREGIDGEDRLLRPALQPLAVAFRLDRNGRLHSRQNCPTLFTYFRDATLASSPKRPDKSLEFSHHSGTAFSVVFRERPCPVAEVRFAQTDSHL